MNYREEGVSIIVPVYNGGAFIEECLRNLCSVDLPLKEIIVVNDGSTDESLSLIENFILANPDSPVRLISQQNSGVAEARNKGLDAAQYGWITFVDADDFLVEHLCFVLDQLPDVNADIYRFGFYHSKSRQMPDMYRNDSKASGKTFHDKLLLMKNSIGFVRSEDEIANPLVCVWGGFYRSWFIREHQIRFPIGVKNGEDRIFNLCCLEYADAVFLSDYPIYVYYTNPSSVTHRFKPDIRDISNAFYLHLDSIVYKHPALKPQRNAALVNNFFLEMGHFLFHPDNKMGIKERWTYFINIYNSFYKDGMESPNYVFSTTAIKRFQLWAMKGGHYRLAFLTFYVKFIIKYILKK